MIFLKTQGERNFPGLTLAVKGQLLTRAPESRQRGIKLVIPFGLAQSPHCLSLHARRKGQLRMVFGNRSTPFGRTKRPT